MVPLPASSDSPGGRLPEVTAYWYGPVPPEAVTCWLSGDPACAAGRVAGARVSVTAGADDDWDGLALGLELGPELGELEAGPEAGGPDPVCAPAPPGVVVCAAAGLVCP